MLITVDSPEAHQYRIYDCEGSSIPFVVSFDTETEEIELSIRVVGKKTETGEELCMLKQKVIENDEEHHAPVIIKFKLPGAYALKDGQPVL